MDIYKTLQDVLNQYDIDIKYQSFIYCDYEWVQLESWDEDTTPSSRITYNKLFSKEEWIIELLERNLIHEDYITIHEHWGFSYDIKSKADIVYMIMWNMTVDEKIYFFLDNVKVPTKV